MDRETERAIAAIAGSSAPIYKQDCVLKYTLDGRPVTVTIPALMRQLEGLGFESGAAAEIARSFVKMPCKRPFPPLEAASLALAA